MSETKRLTSVKVEIDLLNEFKKRCIKNNYTFQKLADRSLYYYINDPDFRAKLHAHIDLKD